MKKKPPDLPFGRRMQLQFTEGIMRGNKRERMTRGTHVGVGGSKKWRRQKK